MPRTAGFCLKVYPSTNMKIPRRRNLSFQMYLLFLSTACFISLRVSDLSILCWFPGILANLDLRCKESQFIWWFRYQQYQIKSDKRSWKKNRALHWTTYFCCGWKNTKWITLLRFEICKSDVKFRFLEHFKTPGNLLAMIHQHGNCLLAMVCNPRYSMNDVEKLISKKSGQT